MFRDSQPRQAEASKVQEERNNRFQILKLEDRIAPRCHTNPHGKEVGCGKSDGTK